MRQAWFAGAHSDVGGGYTEIGLSHITLRWRFDAARTAGLAFDPEVMGDSPLKPDVSEGIHDRLTGLDRLKPRIDRPIGFGSEEEPVPDPTPSVHPTAIEMWERSASYRPRNLAEYFERTRSPYAVRV